MKSFKVREGKMLVDGVYYSDSPSIKVTDDNTGIVEETKPVKKRTSKKSTK